jgi:hypothetical protein
MAGLDPAIQSARVCGLMMHLIESICRADARQLDGRREGGHGEN